MPVLFCAFLYFPDEAAKPVTSQKEGKKDSISWSMVPWGGHGTEQG